MVVSMAIYHMGESMLGWQLKSQGQQGVVEGMEFSSAGVDAEIVVSPVLVCILPEKLHIFADIPAFL